MSEGNLRHEEVEFEREDLSALGVLGFLAGLAITGLLIHIILAGMFIYLDTYQKRHEPPLPPLAKAESADVRHPTSQETAKFPAPRLEVNERAQLYDQLRKEEEILNTYGWVDQKAGVVRLPIERAMELVAQRGLPTSPQIGPRPQVKPGQKSPRPEGRAEQR